MRRLRALLLALLLCAPALPAAALTWPEGAPEALAAYVEQVNETLAYLGEAPINSVFECYPSFAVLGAASADMAEVPEDVEVTVQLQGGEIQYLELRVTDSLERFPALGAALISACAPATVPLDTALKETRSYLERVYRSPDNSFSSQVNTLRGDSPRTYYAYFPTQWPNQNPPVRCLQLTLVFPLAGFDGGAYVTPAPDSPRRDLFNGDGSSDWDGYRPVDDWSGLLEDNYEPELHLTLTTTPTPEPDIDW